MAAFAKSCWLATAVACSAYAQAPAEMTTHSTSATFRGGTHEVEVPVVVRDGKGHTVGGLRLEDFRLLDRGKPQTITRFTALEKGGVPSASAAPERFTLFVVNELFRVRPELHLALMRHLKTALASNERVAIMTNTGRYLIDFTDDVEKLTAAVRRLEDSGVRRVFKGTYDCQGSVDEGHRTMTTYQLEAVRDALNRLDIMPGQRLVVLASPGFLTHDTLLSPPIPCPIPQPPVHMIHASSGPTEEELIQQAIRGRVTINCLDPWMLDPYDPFALPHMRAELGYFCGATGGTYFKENNDLDEGLRQTASAPEHSYLLAFSPQNLKYDGAFHEIKVTLPDRHDDVQARAGYYAPPKLDDPLETARQELSAALYSRDEIAEIPSDMHPGFTRLGSGKVRVNVQVHVGLETLHFNKAGGRNAADLTVVVGLFDRNGIYVSSKSTDVELRLKEENLEDWLHNGIKLGCNLEVAPGQYLVRLVVRDSEGHAMAAHNGSVNVQ